MMILEFLRMLVFLVIGRYPINSKIGKMVNFWQDMIIESFTYLEVRKVGLVSHLEILQSPVP